MPKVDIPTERLTVEWRPSSKTEFWLHKSFEQQERGAPESANRHVHSASSPQLGLSQRQGSEEITSPSSTSLYQVSLAGVDVPHTSFCFNSKACSPIRSHGDIRNWQVRLPLHQFNSGTPWSLSSLATQYSDWFALERRIERVQAASHYLERWSFNFNRLSNGHEQAHMFTSDSSMTWEISIVEVGSQFPPVQTHWMSQNWE